jgi:HEAT repeat protein
MLGRADPTQIDAFDLLVECLGRDAREAAAAARLLSFWRESGWPALDRLRPLLDSPNPSVRHAAAFACAHIEPGAATPVAALVLSLEDDDPDRRREACEALTRVGPLAKAAVGRLVDVLRDPLPPLRIAAARALGAIGPEASRAIGRLEALAADVDERVTLRVTAEAALENIRGE